MSHPTRLDINCPHKSTGYTTNGESIIIEAILFVDSPDVKGIGIPKSHKTEEEAIAVIKQKNDFPQNIQITQNVYGRFGYELNGLPFYRIFEIELCPQQLFTLTYSLCSYLSHPLITTWDGITFQIEKLAA